MNERERASKTAKTSPQKPLIESANRSPLVTIGYLLVLLAAIFAINFGRQLSGDVYSHLKTGEWIATHRSFPWPDPFSYTATKQWIFHEWAFQVFAWFVSRISFEFLTWLCFGLVAGALVLVFFTARSQASIPAAFLVSVLTAGVSADMVDVRPNVAGILAFAVLVWGVENGARSGKGLPYWLPLLFLVWANLHGSFISGLLLLGVECVAAFYTAFREKNKKIDYSIPLRNLAVTFGCGVAVLVNPNGLSLYAYPFKTVGHGEMTSIIAEWMPPDFRSLFGAFLCVLILVLIFAISQSSKPLRPRTLAMIVVFLSASLMAKRIGPLFAIAVAPALASLITPLLSRLLENRWRAWVIGILVIAAVSGGVAYRISDIDGMDVFTYVTSSDVFPAAACDFILKERPPGPMFNELNYGSYLIWRLWPKYKVFIDNRDDIFYEGAFEDFVRVAMVGGNSVWRKIFDKYGVNLVIIMPDTLLADVLTEAPDWQRIYQDDKAVIFVRRVPYKRAVSM
ncbi:MAG: hypothetical protein QHH26_01795 [Armatimonadota bacterium]|nr:hypothetical protein [Armatimonadota bacterium]